MKRVLYIEDNADNRDLVCQILAGLYLVDTAVDGESGLQSAAASPPDIILLDVSLPMMDGLTCARLMRELSVLQTVPIIALTAHCMVGDKERVLKAGCDGFLPKPFRFAELRAKVADLLEHGRPPSL